jgi:hypothetical protein
MLKKLISKEKGVFFTLDALIALTIILLTVMVVYPKVRYSESSNLIQKDVLNVLSNLKMGEYNSACNGCVNDYITNSNDLNKSILEKIGEFYVSNNKPNATALGNSVLKNLDFQDNAVGIGLYYDNQIISSKNKTRGMENSGNIMVEKGYISGIQFGQNLTGYTAKSYLTGNTTSKYFYFGGYVGEGSNISAIIDLSDMKQGPGSCSASNNVIGTYMEFAAEHSKYRKFWVYVNGNGGGYCEMHNIAPSADSFTAISCDNAFLPGCSSATKDLFITGINRIDLVPITWNSIGNESKFFIAGGFIRIDYIKNNSFVEPEGEKMKYLPGMNTNINLYDSFYVPGDLKKMEINISCNSTYNNTLRIGNITVFKGECTPGNPIFFDDTTLALLFDYNDLSNKTIPIRFGPELYIHSGGNADVINVIDKSLSMGCSSCQNGVPICKFIPGYECINKSTCEDPACGSNTWTYKIDKTKNSSKLFVDIILNVSGNRVGLVGYGPKALDSDTHDLSNNNVSLYQKIDDWALESATCISCGINKSITILINQSTSSRNRTIVVMSDGIANYCYSGSCLPSTAKAQAIQAAKDAWQFYGIRVYSIGFGNNVDEDTLRNISIAGNGEYHFANISNIEEIYQEIAQDLILISYTNQSVSENLPRSILYPESYIKLKYEDGLTYYGLILNFEKRFNDEFSGTFFIPDDSEVIEANVASYSGTRWTNNVSINGKSFYNLDDYGMPYIKVGDAYMINIPNNLIKNGTNFVHLTTGNAAGDNESGSKNNTIIYSIRRNIVGYSRVGNNINGCNWTIEFSDYSNMSVNIPNNYSGSNKCYYNSDHHDSTDLNTLPGGNAEQDAFKWAILDLLKQLDFYNDGTVDAKFTIDDLQIKTSEISGIPYFWSTEVQVRKWY